MSKASIRTELTKQADDLLADAFRATQDVLRDQKAPPTARASAVSSAIAIHRMLRGDETGDKEPSEMSYDELQDAIAKARGQLEG